MRYFTRTLLVLFGVLGIVGNAWAYYVRQTVGTTCSGSMCLSMALPTFVSAMTGLLSVSIFVIAVVAEVMARRRASFWPVANKIYAGAVLVLTALYALIGYVWYTKVS